MRKTPIALLATVSATLIAGCEGSVVTLDAGAVFSDGSAAAVPDAGIVLDAGQSPVLPDSGIAASDGGAGSHDAGRFSTLPPKSALPGDSECAGRVRRSPWEPKPENQTANHSVPTAGQLQAFHSEAWGGALPGGSALRARVSGNFSGTTDEIIQWAACKWGFDEDVIRAQAVAESTWRQSHAGDWTTDSSLCPPGTWSGGGCFQSWGLLQLKWIYHAKAAWPAQRDSTAFNVDYAFAWRRLCFEGLIDWLSTASTPGYPAYGAGDLWGCVGQWYSGGWYDSGAIGYVEHVKKILSDREWEKPGF